MLHDYPATAITHHTAIDPTLPTTSFLTAQPSPDSLIDRHLTQIESRALLNDYTRATCRSITHSEAKVYVGNNAPSAGILFMGANGQIQFKPDKPRKKKNGQPIKYESSLGSDFDALLPKHPTNKDYWTKENLLKVCYRINDHPYIGITEGAWKAIAGCANDLPTVALLGVEMGLSGKASDVEGKRHLVAALRMLAEWGFGFIIIFDADAATNPNVRVAERKLARQLAKFNVPVRSITGDWDAGPNGEFNGMDDFIQRKGIEEFRAILSKAKLFGEQETKDEAPRERKLPTARITAAEIAEDYAAKWKFDNEQKCWRIWTEKIWDKAEDGAFRSLLKTVIDAKNVPYKGSAYITDVLSLLTDDLRVNHWQEWDRKRYINFNNGILDGYTGELLPHSPGSGFTSNLPGDYKPLTGNHEDALEALHENCPNTARFLRRAMSGEDKKVLKLLAVIAAMLRFRFFDLQMFVHFLGKPRAGKGVLTRLLQKIAGQENYRACKIAQLSDGSTMAGIISKQLVVFGDERNAAGVDAILNLTGGDAISYREVYKPAASANFYGLLLISSNGPIFVGDTTGLDRRLCLIHFDNPIPAELCDPKIEDLIEAEIPQLIAVALSLSDADATELIRGTGASQIAEFKAREWEMKCTTNSVAAYFDNHLIPDSGVSMPTGEAYKNYKDWCSESGLKPVSLVRFPGMLIDILGELQIDGVHYKRSRGRSTFEGLRFRTRIDTLPTQSEQMTGVEPEYDGGLTGVMRDFKPLQVGSYTDLTGVEAENILENSKIETAIEARVKIAEEEADKKIEKVEKPPQPPSTPVNSQPVRDTTPAPTPVNSRQTPATSNHAASSQKRSAQEFEIGDKVVVAGPAGIYKGASGEVINVCWSREGQECQVQFDKAVRGSLRTEISARDLMKLPTKD